MRARERTLLACNMYAACRLRRAPCTGSLLDVALKQQRAVPGQHQHLGGDVVYSDIL